MLQFSMSRIWFYLHSSTLNKTYKNHEEMNNAPQTFQNNSGILKILAMEEEKNAKKKAIFLKEII